MMRAMTHRERMLAAMRGQPTDRIPWAPRMDLWAIAHRARGDLPARFADKNTVQIARELGVACHAVRADYTIKRQPQELALRGIGIDNHPDYPYRVEVDGLPVHFEHGDGLYQTRIETPAGEVSTVIRMTPKMAADGISLPFVEKYAIESEADFEPVAALFEHLTVVPTPQAYNAFRGRVGDQGVAVGNGSLCASPVHLMLHELCSMEEFYVMYAEEPNAMHALGERMVSFFDAMLDAALLSDAEVIFWGANYDQDLTWPTFFKKEITPWLSRVSDRAHAADKLVLTHTDGENRNLLPLYPDCKFDVAESVCPAPMTQCTVREVREGMGTDITVFGGIPCVALMDESMSQSEFEQHMDQLFADFDGNARRLILGVSDNVPPGVNFDRLAQINDWIERFGEVT
jgi:uroporphyrinogen-III decarboxylase